MTALLLMLYLNPLFPANNQERLVKRINATTNSQIETNIFTAICFKYPRERDGALRAQIDGKTYQLFAEAHSNQTDSILISQLIVFDKPQNSFLLLCDSMANFTIEAYLLYAPQITLHTSKNDSIDGCEEPPIIPQSQWREGLPDPAYERIPNQVNNLIIHHSATDNSMSDYTSLVRSIYLYHTEVNGWSDIGYNYLIAPDGSIYAGRDPGPELDQDNVLGAHFCASNTGTMGVCLLGNFELTTPSLNAIASVLKLFSWKTAKDMMNPLSTVFHPLNEELGVIAGHRDGCATSCPGVHLYEEIPQIKSDVVENLHSCGFFPGTNDQQSIHPHISLFPNPANSKKLTVKIADEAILSIVATSLAGRQIELYTVNDTNHRCEINLEISLPPGIYLLLIKTIRGVYTAKLQVVA